jgi:hypothetical protein
MLLVQKCQLCGKPSEIEVDDAKYMEYQRGLREGLSAGTHGIQVIFSDLDADDRETIMTGTHAKCFDELFGSEDG